MTAQEDSPGANRSEFNNGSPREVNSITRREFCASTTAAAAAIAASGLMGAPVAAEAQPLAPGDWPTARQNRCLTSIQPLAGKMKTAPAIAGHISFPTGQGVLLPISLKPGGEADHVIQRAYGSLRCFSPDGQQVWESHPPGINFAEMVASEDLDGDGRVELVLMAGRPTAPLGAVVILAADTGQLLFRYDVEPMSYWWTLKVDHFLPDVKSKQILVCEHAYPPDAKLGYLAMFEYEKPGQKPTQRWRYDFSNYTCFPSILRADVKGTGVKDICIETHSHMWVIDPGSGKVNQYVEWTAKPANVRSYGLVRFQDLNGDGLPEFFCIGNFSHHHEVLLNDKGTLKKAWAHGWDNSVSTSKLATTWPDPPIADVDGDGKLEMLVSMFNSESDGRWMIRIYDAMTGVLKVRVPDRNAVQLIDIDGDGIPEILADITTDPTRTDITGASVVKIKNGAAKEIWQQQKALAVALPEREGDAATLVRKAAYVAVGNEQKRITMDKGGTVVLLDERPPAPPRHRSFPKVPANISNQIDAPLVADVDGDGKNEVIHYFNKQVTVYRCLKGGKFEVMEAYPSDGEPTLADLDGDGRPELIVGSATPTTDPVIEAIKLATGGKRLWKVTLPRPDRNTMPYGRPLYFQTGRFTGKKTYDVYVLTGTPLVRSIMLEGTTGAKLWEKGEIPGIERYFGPTVNRAAVWDINGDGKEDLVFTNPDYYCVASGPTGEALVGPAFPPKIFKQASQGLYTLPAILPERSGEPTICLVDGAYFRAAMTSHASPYWYQLPIVGTARAGSEGFVQTKQGRWLMGIGREDGIFACLDARTGTTLWEYPLQSTASDLCTCDINGDGRQEFVFGTSHGDVYALADRDGKPHLVWRARLSAGVNALVVADVNGDGVSEILASLENGQICLLDVPRSKSS